MPLTLRDRKLATLYRALEAQRQTNPTVKVDQEAALKLLAAVGDGSRSGEAVLTELKKPGVTREQQVALIQKGMTANEKSDLFAILDKGTVPLDASAKAFLEAVVGRATPGVPGGPAALSLGRIGLKDLGNGKVELSSLYPDAAPGARGLKVQLTNDRTGQKTLITLDAKGHVPPGATAAGRAGDTFTLAASDGVKNKDFAAANGKLTVPGGSNGTVDLIKDPTLHKDELTADGKPKFDKRRFGGPLVKNSLSPNDVEQGALGNCYFAAAMSSLAQDYPEALAKAMVDNKDGTYTFNFKERDWATGRLRNVAVKVDGDLYVKLTGSPLYGRAAGDKTAPKMELWYPLFEKAYAQFKGSYHSIGEGGWSSEVFQDVMGFKPASQNITETPAGLERAWTTLKQAVDGNWPICAGTYGETQEARYTNTGVHANHAYTVLGYEEQGGKRYVKLRNPWGVDEPSGNGADDGVFRLELSKFAHLYQNFEIGKP